MESDNSAARAADNSRSSPGPSADLSGSPSFEHVIAMHAPQQHGLVTRAQLLVAVLACGCGAALSHLSAGSL